MHSGLWSPATLQCLLHAVHDLLLPLLLPPLRPLLAGFMNPLPALAPSCRQLAGCVVTNRRHQDLWQVLLLPGGGRLLRLLPVNPLLLSVLLEPLPGAEHLGLQVEGAPRLVHLEQVLVLLPRHTGGQEPPYAVMNCG